MRIGIVALFCCLVAALPAAARSERHSHLHGGNCVAYARAVSGVRLDGDAATWWRHAEGRYARGHEPAVGAVLVFKPHGRMHSGHVAVVSRLVGPREILVDHANWVRGRVTTAMAVIDVSPGNDWTLVKVRSARGGARDNPTFGFIYPQHVPVRFALDSGSEPNRPRHARRHRLANSAD